MSTNFSRRTILQTAEPPRLSKARPLSAASIAGPRAEGKDTPKICLGLGDGGATSGPLDPAAAKRIAQLGVESRAYRRWPDSVEENQLKDMIDRLKANGLSLGNLMIAGFPNNAVWKAGP